MDQTYKAIVNIILDMGARLTSKELVILSFILCKCYEAMPDIPPLKEIIVDVKNQCNARSVHAVEKTLERAVTRIFNTGDKEVLATYQRNWLYDKPFPNEFVRVVAARLWANNETLSDELELVNV